MILLCVLLKGLGYQMKKRNHKAPKWYIKIGAVGDFIQLCQLTNAHQPPPQRILYAIDLIIAL